MRLKKILALALCMLVLLSSPAALYAGSFNCAVVYDEFESLMNKRFLSAPDQFVRTLPGRISREQFNGVANAGFRLYESRAGMGIGILITNLNIHAKFLFRWSEPMTDGSVHVIIDEVVKYGRVADGYAPSRIGPFRLKPGMSVDIDTGRYVRFEEGLVEEGTELTRETGDLQYEAGPDGAFLRSANGAEVQFPLETLCQGDGG